jgi:hypothetical protein
LIEYEGDIIMKSFSIVTKLVVVISMMFSLLSYTLAGNRSGTTSEAFLKISTSARGVGVGGAQVAIAEGVSSIAFNPAGMLSISDWGAGSSYTSWFAGIQHSYFGIVKNISGIGAVGLSLTMLTTGDIIETTPSKPEGTGLIFRASDYALSFAYARQVTEQFRVGINAKYIKSYLYNTEIGGSSIAFDIGTLYDIPILRSHLGVALTNIGKDVKFLDEQYSIPTALRFGVMVDLYKESAHSVVSIIQISRVNDAEEQYNLGAEYVFNNMISLRGGYKFAYDQEDFAGGFGVKMNSFGINGTLDYAYNNFKYLPGTHAFSVEFDF